MNGFPIPELITVISICETDGCMNSSVGIEIQTVKDNPMVVCGVCGVNARLVVIGEEAS